jgi:CSLREA domain-containing protein
LKTKQLDFRAPQRVLSIFVSVAAAALCLATPATGANLIVDSGLDQAGNPGSSSPYNQSSGSANYDSGYVCVQNSGVVNHSGGALTFSVALYLKYAGPDGATGTYNLSGSGVLSTPWIYVPYGGGVATFNQNGGTNTVSDTLFLGTGNGTYTLNAGTLSAAEEELGNGGIGVFTQNGGTNTVSGTVTLGFFSSGTGAYNLNGGVLQTTRVARGATVGIFNFNGGILQARTDTTTFMEGLSIANVKAGGVKIDTNGHNVRIAQPLVKNATPDGGLTKLGSGTLTLAITFPPSGSPFDGGINLEAGVLSVGTDVNLGDPANALNFNGGTLQIIGTALTTFNSHPVNDTTFNGGLDIAAAANNFSVPGGLSGSNLTKAGAGTLTLSGTNSFTGTTTISAGTLTFGSGATFSSTALSLSTGAVFNTANLPSGALTVGTGQSLGGTGTVSGAVAIGSGGNLAPGNSVGTMTVGSLTLSTGSISTYEFNGTANDFTTVTGSNGLTINGGGFNLYDEGTTDAFDTVGSYDLIGYSGTLQGSTSSLSLLNPAPGRIYTFSNDPTGHRIVLTISLPPDVSVAVSPAAVAEDGTPNLEFTFTRSNTSGTLTVNFSVDGTAVYNTDYTQSGADSFSSTSGVVTFAANSSTAVVTIDPTADTTFENNETVVLTITSDAAYNPISPTSATGTINDDDGPPVIEFSAANYPVGESDGSVTITVNKTGLSALPSTVNYSTSNATATAGSDYTATSGTLTFLAGETSQTFTVPITPDTVYEANEQFNLTLSMPVGATLGPQSTAKGTITNDDTAPSISIDNGSGTEGGPVGFTVTQSAPSGVDTTFKYSTADGTATSADYTGVTNVTGTITAGNTTTTISIPTTEDSVYEGNETFTVALSDPNNATIGTATGTGTITENDPAPSFTINDVTHLEGNSGTTDYVFTVTKSATNTAVDAKVDYATADGTATQPSDYTAIPATTLTFAPGETTKQFTVSVNGDTTTEPDETFTVQLSNPFDATIADPSGLGTIQNDDCTPPPSGMISWWSGENNPNDIQGPNNGTWVGTPAYGTGKVGQAFDFDGTNKRVTASGAGSLNLTGSQMTMDGWINPRTNTPGTFYFAKSALSDHPYVVFLGAGATIHVIVSTTGGDNQEFDTGFTPPVNTWTHLAMVYSNPNLKFYVNGAVVLSVNVPLTGNLRSSTIPFGIGNRATDPGVFFNGLIDEVEVFNTALSATDLTNIYNAGSSGKCHLSTFQFSAPTYNVSENGGTATITVTRTGTHDTGATVDYATVTGGTATAGGSCTPGTDYITTSNTLNFAATETSKTFTIPICNDGVFENAETVNLQLSNPTGAGASVGTPATAVLTITNEDCYEPPPQMVAWYAGEGNNNDIQGPTFENGSNGGTPAVGFAGGQVGQAFSFTGTNFVTMGNVGPLAISNDKVSIDGWIKPNTTNPGGHYFGKALSGGHDYAVIFTNGTLNGVIRTASGETVVAPGLAPVGGSVYVPAAGVWTHVALTYDGANVRLYANGVQIGAVAKTGNISSVGAPFNIGGRQDGFDFNGQVDEVEVFTRALTPQEIADLFNAGSFGKCKHGLIQFGAPTYSVSEAGPSFDVTVKRTDGGVGAVSATFNTSNGTATAGSDYTAVTNFTVSWADGNTDDKLVNIPINNDSIYESNETVNLALTNATGGAQIGPQGTAVLTINDNDTAPVFTINDVPPQAEGDAGTSNIVFTVTKTGATELSSTVTFATVDGTAMTADGDYVSNTNTLTFAPGDNSQPITVVVNGDVKFENTENFTVHLSDATNATISDADGVGTITNDEPVPAISIDSVQVDESGGNAVFTVTQSGLSAFTTTFNYSTADGSAVAPGDYTAAINAPGSITAGNTTTTISIPINDDNIFETDETFTVKLSNPNNAVLGTDTGTGTILNNDTIPAISIADVTHNEGNSGNTSYDFAVTLSNPSYQTITVDYATADGSATAPSDYTALSTTQLSFSPGQTSQTVTVQVKGDTTHEADETFFVNLTNPSNATIADNQGLGTITNDDPLPAISINDATPQNEGNTHDPGNIPDETNHTFTISLSNPSDETITVDYATANGSATAPSDYTAITITTLTFNPGETSKTVTVVVKGDTTYEKDETFFVNLSNASATATIDDGQGIGTITNDDAKPTLSINDRTNNEGTMPTPLPNPTPLPFTTMTFTVTKAGSTDVSATVNYATANGTAIGNVNPCPSGDDYQTQNDSLTFGANETSKTITVSVCKDSAFEANETFFVNLSAPSDATLADGQGQGTILNDDIPEAGFTVNTTDDTDDTICNAAHCSLREAIIAANNSNTVVLINFDIPADDSHNLAGPRHFYYADDGIQGQVTLANVTVTAASDDTAIVGIDPDWPHSWWSILPTSPLPAVTKQVFIDGYAQAGAVFNSFTASTRAVLRVELDGSSAGANATGLTVAGSTSTVRGLVINRFRSDGSAPTPLGDSLVLSSGGNHTITGNFIGTDVSGTLDVAAATVPPLVTGNGISAPSSNNSIGGASPDVVNLIAGNGRDGISFPNSNTNVVRGNLIGTKADGTSALGNGGNGITFSGGGSVFNTVGGPDPAEGNTIAFNGSDGVSLNTAGFGNSIRGNSIFSNGATSLDLGIDLGSDGVTANDLPDQKDADTGPNNLQNFPVITAARVTGSTKTITGSLDSEAGQAYTIDFYANSVCDSLGGNGEGQTYLGSMTTAETDAAGHVLFTFHPDANHAADMTVDKFITATATSTGAIFNTSEFSACFEVEDGSNGAGEIQFDPLQTFQVAENDASHQYVVKLLRVGGSNGQIQTTFATSDGTATAGSDYTDSDQTVIFEEGETSKTINIPITDDSIYEGNETVNLNLGDRQINLPNLIDPSAPAQKQATAASAVLTITENDPAPAFSINDVSHSEGNSGTTAYTFTITKTGGSTALNADVTYATVAGTAVAPSDFAAIPATTVSFLPADTIKQVTVQVNGDTNVEPDEAFTVHLSNAVNATISDADGTGTIVNDDAATFSIDDVTKNEGNGGTTSFTFTVTISGAPLTSASVKVQAQDGSATQEDNDYQAMSKTLTFTSGDPQQVTVLVNGDTQFETDETFFVHLSNAVSATISRADGIGTIVNDDAAPTPTATPTATATATAAPTATATATATSTPTATPTSTPTATATATPTATATATPTATPVHALNISTRLRADTGDNAMIAGFIITGNSSKAVVLRGMGPSLAAFGITDLLLDPVLDLRNSDSSLILRNDNWKDDQRSQIEGTLFQPSDDRESVIVASLTPANYTGVLTGKNNTAGVGLIEVYDNSQGVDSQLANISTRGFVQNGSNVMIGGFILGGGQPDARVALRGIGPSLSQFGLKNVLADPTLELHDANGATLVANDDWTDDPASAALLTANGLGLSNAKESGIFTSLPAGQFTAILAGKDGGVGIGLVEIYNVK